MLDVGGGQECPRCGSTDIKEGLNFAILEGRRVKVAGAEEPTIVPTCQACGARLKITRVEPNVTVETYDEDEEKE